MAHPELVNAASTQGQQIADLVHDDMASKDAMNDWLEDRTLEFEVIPRGVGAEGTVVVRGEILVWKADADRVVVLLQSQFPSAFRVPDDVATATPRVAIVRLAQAGEQLPEDALVQAVALVYEAGFRVSFHYVQGSNDLRLLGVPPESPNQTVKSAVPPEPLERYRIPHRPRRPWLLRLPPLPWPFDFLLQQPRVVKVAVIDTGVDPERNTQFPGRRSDGWLYDVNGDDEADATGIDPLTRLKPAVGHGTAVAGVVQFLAPWAEVTSYQALEQGAGTEVDVAKAILRAVEDEADVINLSLGQIVPQELAPLALEDALSLVPDDTFVVAAAGNSDSRQPSYPAGFKRVLAVGATDFDGVRAPYSNYGHWVDFSTYGTVGAPFVHGTPPGKGGRPIGYDGAPRVGNANVKISGTSFAAPIVAGRLAALLAQRRSPRAALAALKAEGRLLNNLGIFVHPLEQQ